MAGHVTELVAASWMAKPWGRSSRSTAPGLPSRSAGAGGCAVAGRELSQSVRIRTNPETRGALDMDGVSLMTRRSPLTPPSPRDGERGRGGAGGSDGDGLVDRHAP